MNAFIVASLNYGPPGLVHPLLVEKYAWIDTRLEELYTTFEENDNNCQNLKILTENEVWLKTWLSLDDAINQTTTIIQRLLFRDVR